MRHAIVWITGIGSVTAAGAGTGPLRRLLRSGTSALRRCPKLDGRWVGRAPDPPSAGIARRLDRSARLFLMAAEEAWNDAGLEPGVPDSDRSGVIEGSSLGPMADLLAAHSLVCSAAGRSESDADKAGHRRGSPSSILTFMTGAGGAAFAQRHGITGPVLHLSAGSVSSAAALGDAFQRIAAGELDLVVAGGAECPLQEDIVGTFTAAGILADATEEDPCCRPFDARHSGTSLGEGAGILILESEEHARARGANCRAILQGYGMCAEEYSMIAPDPEGSGVERAARQALASGGELAHVDWIKTHGTGTRRNDAAECRGLARIWPERFASMPLTSMKPILGHCLGASGAVEAVACLLAMEEELIPSLVDCDVPDPELPPCCLVRTPERRRSESVLLLSESFGGRCAALHLERHAK